MWALKTGQTSIDTKCSPRALRARLNTNDLVFFDALRNTCDYEDLGGPFTHGPSLIPDLEYNEESMEVQANTEVVAHVCRNFGSQIQV